MFKKLFTLFPCIIPWFIFYLISPDYNYYNTIILPFFAPPQPFYIIIWISLYILIGISVYIIIKNYKLKDIPKSYKKILLINYILNESYILIFYKLKNIFLSFVIATSIFIASLFLYNETNKLNEKSTKFLDLYIIFSLFTSILSLIIYIINTI